MLPTSSRPAARLESIPRPVAGQLARCHAIRPEIVGTSFANSALEVYMTVRLFVSTIAIGVACSTLVGAGSQGSQSTQKPKVAIPNPGVPQIMTLEDRFVRISYNNEGYVTMGYRLANGLQGKEWIRLEVGLALREGVQAFKLPRTSVSLTTPTGDVPLPTQTEYSQADLRGLDQQAKVINDAINYFPPNIRGGCRIGFFSEL